MKGRRARLVVTVVALALAPRVGAQADTPSVPAVDDTKLPRFDVASVKPGDPNAGFSSVGIPPGRFTMQNGALFPSVLAMAFGVEPRQIATPLPDVVTRDRFTIEARMPPGARPVDRLLMLRALLVDRFKLRYHVEQATVDGFALRVARRDGKLGPELRVSSLDCASRLAARARQEPLPRLPAGAAECSPQLGGPGVIAFRGMSIQSLVLLLRGATGNPIVDETGLSGMFDVELHYALPSAAAVPRTDAAASPLDDAPSVFTAVQEQLGLRLAPIKMQDARVVIEHIERPDPD